MQRFEQKYSANNICNVCPDNALEASCAQLSLIRSDAGVQGPDQPKWDLSPQSQADPGTWQPPASIGPWKNHAHLLQMPRKQETHIVFAGT